VDTAIAWSAATTHRALDGHETPSAPVRPGTTVRVQVAAELPGAPVMIRPVSSTATQSVIDAHEIASIEVPPGCASICRGGLQ
jgi:hypothetical protein